MSRTAIIIALLVAAALSLAAVFLMKSGGNAGPAGPLLGGFDIGGVDRMEIEAPGAAPISIALSDRVPGVWVMRWKDAGGAERSWPAAASRVRGALRLLADLRVDPVAPEGAPSDGEIRVALRGSSGAREMRLASSAVAGRTRVRVADGAGVALGDAALLQVFGSGTTDTWREPSIFGAEITDASRLMIGAQGNEVILSRVGRNWGMQKPRVAPADEPVISTVLNAMASVAARSVLGRATTDTESAFARGTSQIIVESTRRDLEGSDARRWALVQSVTIGGAADVAGTSVFARLEAMSEDAATGAREVLWGPVIAVVDASALNAIPADPFAYFSRVSLRTAAPDIGALAFEPAGPMLSRAWTAKRTAQGWASGEGPAGLHASAALDKLLDLLTRERADAVQAEEPAGFVGAADVTATSVDGQVDEEFRLLVPSPGPAAGRGVLVVYAGGARRTYSSPNAANIAEWLRGGASPSK